MGTRSDGSVPVAPTDLATKAYVDARAAGGTTYYQALATPQAFAYAGSNVFTLASPAAAVVSVELNGQALQPSEYALATSTTVTVTLESTALVTGDKVVVTYVLTGSFTGTSGQDLEITDPTKGVILRSLNGTRWRITVSNAGVLTTTAVT